MLSVNEYAPGQLVRSRAGRDKDRLFIIIGQIDDQYVTIVDGDLRRVANPKKKKIRHLSRIHRVSETLKGHIERNEPFNDALVRREIEYLGQQSPSSREE